MKNTSPQRRFKPGDLVAILIRDEGNPDEGIPVREPGSTALVYKYHRASYAVPAHYELLHSTAAGTERLFIAPEHLSAAR